MRGAHTYPPQPQPNTKTSNLIIDTPQPANLKLSILFKIQNYLQILVLEVGEDSGKGSLVGN